MAQELVLIPKSKYEHLLQKCRKENNKICSLQENQQTDKPELKQNGGQMSTEEINNKKFFVQRSNNAFEKTIPIVKKKRSNNAVQRTMPIVKKKQMEKTKWIVYNV